MEELVKKVDRQFPAASSKAEATPSGQSSRHIVQEHPELFLGDKVHSKPNEVNQPKENYFPVN